MKFRSLSYGITAAAFVVSCMVPMRVAAQGSSQIGGANGSAREAAIKAAEAKPTPRTADGHPDLNGSWGGAPRNTAANTPAVTGNDSLRRQTPGQDANGNVFVGVVEPIPEGLQPRHKDPNAPPYKPELLAKVEDLASHSIDTDPQWHCIPDGVPRSGAPAQIVQTPKLIVFLYQTEIAVPFRLIPTDGRPHRTDVDPSYYGDSIGHWEGDTLVVDVNQLSEETRLPRTHVGGFDQYGSGYFHSDALRVIERITRKGDTLRWEATVEDPKVLTGPWVMNPQTKFLTDGMVYPQPICEEREAKHMVDRY